MPAPRKVKAEVVDLKRYRDDITFFRFKPELQCRFKPGQFLHLALDNYDPSFNWPESRVFSIANSPGKDYIDILVSPKGWFTQRMVKELEVGSKIWLKLPFGSFNFDASINKQIILIAGGTGISPFISLLEYFLESESTQPNLNLYYGVRNSELIIFENLFEKCLQKINNFKYHIYCEKKNKEDELKFHTGILPIPEIVQETSPIKESIYYLSGPAGMINAFTKEMILKGIPSDCIFFDKWE
jgi:NAD(P)H-flavin reductase